MSDINVQVSHAVSADVLWNSLVDPDKFGRWCMTERGFQLAKGQEFTLESDPNRFWDGVFVCRVEDFEEGSRLRYSYKNEGLGLDGLVEWRISEDRAGSILELRQTGFEGLKGAFYKALLGAGWKHMLRKNLARELAIA